MTDEIISVLADYALDVDERIPPATAAEVRRKLIDVAGCALAALHEPATHSARRYVYGHGIPGPSLIWGTGIRTSPPLSAFANGTAVRCLDFNDGYQSRRGDAGGHPSDVIPGLCGVAEMVGASGTELASAIAKKKTKVEGELCCEGWQSKARINTVHCHNKLRYKLKLAY